MFTQNRIRFISFLFLFCFVVSVIAKQDPLVLGEFKVSRVIDGDTIAVEGLKQTIRFLCIDTEECEKGSGAEERTAEIAKNWASYVKEQTKNNPNPKFDTPLGMDGKHFAEKWFPIGSTVRIELDDPGKIYGYYGRHLGYVFAKKDGKWVNYNVECVRAGMSPYSDKYGPSNRFECQFIEAEREARINERGIWAPNAMAYPNYDSRLKWWNRRGKAFKVFESKYASKPNAIEVISDSGWDRMPKLVGKEVYLFGTISFNGSSKTPIIMSMDHNNETSVAVEFPNEKYYNEISSKLDRYREDMVYFRGTLEKGIERNNRTYAYSISIQSSGQFFVDNPGVEEPELIPRHVEAEPTPEVSKSVSTTKIAGEAIPYEEAPKHMDEEVIITGKIVRTNNIGNLTFLNFDRSRESLTLIVFKENYSKFPEPAEKLYLNHTIKAKGKVVSYQGKPEIIIQGPEQIEILE